MFLHLGRDIVIRHRDIIGIFNMETSTVSGHSKRFLADAQKGGRVVNVCEEKLPAAFAVCENSEQGETVYISQISSATLLNRVRKKAVF